MRHEVRQDTAAGRVTMTADMRRRGVKIHHPYLRGVIFTVSNPLKPYRQPYPCPQCGVTHLVKTYHFNLDSNGDVTVSEEVYQYLRDNGVACSRGDDLVAVRPSIPRPFAVAMPTIDARPVLIPTGEGAPVEVFRPQRPVWQPPDVISREEGLVKVGGLPRLNSVLPPQDRFRREPDGSWTDLERERKAHGEHRRH